MKNRTYRFTEKDPVCGELMTMVEDSGLRGKEHIGKLAVLATKAHGTIEGILYGDTKRPQNATIMAVATALGYERTWQRMTNKFDLEAELEKAKAWIRKQRKIAEEAKPKRRNTKKRKQPRAKVTKKGHLRLVSSRAA